MAHIEFRGQLSGICYHLPPRWRGVSPFCSFTVCSRLAGMFLLPAFHTILWALGIQLCATTSSFLMWVLGIKTLVVKFPWQPLLPTRSFPLHFHLWHKYDNFLSLLEAFSSVFFNFLFFDCRFTWNSIPDKERRALNSRSACFPCSTSWSWL